ncbi:MAG: hypothetical protein OXC14_11535 [Rhodospirillaceae bacterium]|nr:hypothetical protein [Rhodospirillaceae bacterium]
MAHQARRTTEAGTRQGQELGIEFSSINYTQGRYGFVDIAAAPPPEAMLNFSVWYVKQGFGSFGSLPAFSDATMAAASKEE